MASHSRRPHYVNLEALHWVFAQRVAGRDARGRALDPAIGSRILVQLGYMADSANGSEISLDSLAEDCQCGRRSVISWLKVFEGDGLITKAAGTSRGGRPVNRIILSLSAPGTLNDGLSDKDLDAPGALKTRSIGALGAEKSADQRPDFSAPGADFSAPGAGLGAPGAPLLNINNKTPLPPLMQEANMAVRDVLTAVGVLPETAETLMLLRMQQDTPLTVRSAQRLLRSFGTSDPETECLAIIARALETKRSASTAQNVTDGAGQKYKPLEVATNRAFALTCLKLWGERDGKDRMWMASQAAISVPEGIIEAARQKLAAPNAKQA